jgi:hypothetical protein
MAEMVSKGKRPGGPWYGEFRRRLLFERNARRVYPQLKGATGRHREIYGFAYRVTVEIPTYGTRTLTIIFPRRAPRNPRVFSDGPFLGRHRFDDGSLCMWYGRDPSHQRWVFDDGLHKLIDHAILHLFKEAWFIDTGEWLGDEIIHHQRKGAA